MRSVGQQRRRGSSRNRSGWTCCSATMAWRTRPLPLLLLLLFALALLFLLECNCLSLICRLAWNRSFPNLGAPIANAPPLRFLGGESGHRNGKTYVSSRFYSDSVDGRTPPASPATTRRAPTSKQRGNLLLKILQTNAQSRTFAKRTDDFFRGHRSGPPCKDRFFMAWISSLEAFGPRELFSVESLFKSHPHACLLIVSNTMDSTLGSLLLKPFVERGFRVAAVSPDFTHLLKRTPAAPWFHRLRRREVSPGEVPLGQNLSNLLRLAVLYKYGGVYVDTDVIILKGFGGLRNTIGAQAVDAGTGNWTRLNNAVMVFDRRHPLLYKFLQEFAMTFDGNKWGHNGPYLVSRVAARIRGKPGYSFSVLPPPAFYPVGWNKISTLFSGPRNQSHSRWISENLGWIRGASYSLHLWNKQSSRIKVEEGSVISRIMLDSCVICNLSSSLVHKE